MTFLLNILAFIVVFIAIGFLIRGKSFWYFLALGEALNLLDLLLIDYVWWQPSKQVRFTGIGNRKDYLGAEKHVMAFVRAIPVFAVVALLAAVIL